MKNIILILFTIVPILSFAQNNCDNLVISCCTPNLDDPNFLEVEVTDMTPFPVEFFDYPGFILLDQNGDTIAKETVNYFGIGSNTQTHLLEKWQNLVLPFEGELHLFSSFYDSLHCIFPIIIDETNSIFIPEISNTDISIFPNPTRGIVQIKGEDLNKYQNLSLDLFNALGQRIYSSNISGDETVVFLPILKGTYFVQLYDKEKIIFADKLFLE